MANLQAKKLRDWGVIGKAIRWWAMNCTDQFRVGGKSVEGGSREETEMGPCGWVANGDVGKLCMIGWNER